MLELLEMFKATSRHPRIFDDKEEGGHVLSVALVKINHVVNDVCFFR